MFHWHLPEVDTLYEGPVQTLCQEGGNEVLPYSILDVLHIAVDLMYADSSGTEHC